MANEDLKRLQELDKAASAAPWGVETEQYTSVVVAPEAGVPTEIFQVLASALNREQANAQLVVETRNSLRRLLSELVELRERARNGDLLLKAVVAKSGAPVEVSVEDLARAKGLQLFEEKLDPERVKLVIR